MGRVLEFLRSVSKNQIKHIFMIMLAQLFDVADVLLHLLLVLHHEFP